MEDGNEKKFIQYGEYIGNMNVQIVALYVPQVLIITNLLGTIIVHTVARKWIYNIAEGRNGFLVWLITRRQWGQHPFPQPATSDGSV